MCHGVNKIQKKTGNWGPGPWNSEITPKLWTGTMVFRNYSEITPKSFRNYSETTPKLANRGIPKLLRNYSETMDRDYGIPKLLRNYSETVGLGPWNSEIMGLGPWNYGITPKLLRNYGLGLWYSEITPKLSTVELRNYGTGTVAVELRKLWLAIVLYWFWSVGLSPETPPGRLKTLLLRSVFYTLCRQRSANQQSRMPTRHLADQSAIASRRTPLFYRLFYRSPCVIFTKLIK